MKVQYSLTSAGRSLETIVDDFLEWKHEYLEYVAEQEEGDDSENDDDGDGT